MVNNQKQAYIYLKITKLMKRLLLLSLSIFAGVSMLAQGVSVSGKVVDKVSGETLVGANVVIQGTPTGTSTDVNGRFKLNHVPEGASLSASMLGYETLTKPVSATMTFELAASATELSELEIVADRSSRDAPFAFTFMKKKDIVNQLGSRDIPLVLNTAPSVYATNSGGGAGDARINVRGFNQRNVAIMINGVPVNDMENGWVYWSNWDGVGDATSSIQLQRGMSSVNLATPSIGGTMNIITDPASKIQGASVKQEFGSWDFHKTTVTLNSGLINDKFAINGTLVRKTGGGFHEGTYTDAYAYYLGMSYKLSSKNKLEFFVIGAPQKHGQNLYKQNIATYSHAFASGLSDYDPAALDKFKEQGFNFNQNYSPVHTSYRGKQSYGMYNYFGEVDRKDPSYILERENFFHKPQVNLNFYHTFNEKLQWSTIAYYSGGAGGGAGTYGQVYRTDANGNLGGQNYKFYYGPSPWKWDWNQTIAMNSANADTFWVDKKPYWKENQQSIGILRASRNDQWTVGTISKLYYKVNEHLKTTVGIDWRTANIHHYREVRDLLGGQYFVYTGNDFDTDSLSQIKHLGDVIAYNFTNTVDWLGAYAQGQYEANNFNAYLMLGWNSIGYTYTNHFIDAKNDGNPNTNPNAKNELYLESKGHNGYQIKGGAMYKINDNFGLYANGGYISKTPIFDGVINDQTATAYANPKNERFRSFEGGVDIKTNDGTFASKINYYNTLWLDRTQVTQYTMQDGTDGYVFLTGMNASHSGLEFEASWQPCKQFRIDGSASLGKWILTNDVSGSYTSWSTDSLGNPVASTVDYKYYVKGLRVGDAPQTQFSLTPSFYPSNNLMIQLVYRYYANNYGDWDPFGRTDPTDLTQSWKAPNYAVVDMNANYTIPLKVDGMQAVVFLHVFNLLDNVYIQDAVDNSKYNAFDKNHTADDAEVFFGLPRNVNAGFRLRF